MPTTPKSIYRGPVGLGGVLGATWFTRSGMTGGATNGMLFGNGVFITTVNQTNYSTTLSADGVTWTTTSNNSAVHGAAGFGAGLFVRAHTNPDAAKISTSPDGSNWTVRNLPAAGQWNWMSYGAGLFLMTADAAVSNTSPDGITWTARAMPASGYWRHAYGNGLFVAFIVNQTVNATSPDGITWTTRAALPSANLDKITFGGGLFLAYGASSSTAYTSPDGITWTPRTLPGTGWQQSTYGAGMFAIANNVGNFVATSPDAITWTKRPVPGNTFPQFIAFGNNTFAVAGSGSGATSHGGAATLYTTPPASSAVLTDVVVNNPNNVATPVTLQIDGIDLLTQTSVAANDRIAITTKQVLDSNKTVVAYTNGNTVNVHLNGVEIS